MGLILKKTTWGLGTPVVLVFEHHPKKELALAGTGWAWDFDEGILKRLGWGAGASGGGLPKNFN